MQPLEGQLVVDFTRQLPGPYASRELMRLGARVVKIEPPGGRPDARRRAGLVRGDQRRQGDRRAGTSRAPDSPVAQELCDEADVILDGFRPGVFDRLGLRVPETAVYCAITGFGTEGRHALSAPATTSTTWAGRALLADTAPAVPPTQVADLAAGALGAIVEILAALLERERTGKRTAHHDLDDARLAQAGRAPAAAAIPCRKLLDGGRSPAMRSTRRPTGAISPSARSSRSSGSGSASSSSELDLVERHYDPSAAGDVGDAIATRSLAEWLELFDGEDVCVGPVYTLEEAAAEFGA